MNMNKTRSENINGKVYCTYCGRLLKDPNFGVYPEPPMFCNCEKALEELKLYDKLKELYNSPLAENLIELKINDYRNQLLGIRPTITIPV